MGQETAHEELKKGNTEPLSGSRKPSTAMEIHEEAPELVHIPDSEGQEPASDIRRREEDRSRTSS